MLVENNLHHNGNTISLHDVLLATGFHGLMGSVLRPNPNISPKNWKLGLKEPHHSFKIQLATSQI